VLCGRQVPVRELQLCSRCPKLAVDVFEPGLLAVPRLHHTFELEAHRVHARLDLARMFPLRTDPTRRRGRRGEREKNAERASGGDRRQVDDPHEDGIFLARSCDNTACTCDTARCHASFPVPLLGHENRPAKRRNFVAEESQPQEETEGMGEGAGEQGSATRDIAKGAAVGAAAGAATGAAAAVAKQKLSSSGDPDDANDADDVDEADDGEEQSV
jgi:hypothetical protein